MTYALICMPHELNLPCRVDGLKRGNTMDNTILVRQLYAHFNARDIDAILEFFSENVVWANGLEGGYVHGPAAVRAYWTEQWSQINPHVEPLHLVQGEDGSVRVEVHQVVRDLQGQVLLDEKVQHLFQLDQGRVVQFDIASLSQLSTLAH
jgi:ketosteroid isomerase-like protein